MVQRDDFDEDDLLRIVDGELDPFEVDHLDMAWMAKTDHVVLEESGRAIAHAGWVHVEVEPEGHRPVAAIGLGGVLVHHDHRGRGLGRRVVEEAVALMALEERPIALLFCLVDRLALYRRLGWHRQQGEVVVDQPSGPVVMPLETCWLPLFPGASLPDGGLRTPGLPF
ncbi:MAG: GNAT family N-acetyltransferase [Acidimicrobiales bacterium]